MFRDTQAVLVWTMTTLLFTHQIVYFSLPLNFQYLPWSSTGMFLSYCLQTSPAVWTPEYHCAQCCCIPLVDSIPTRLLNPRPVIEYDYIEWKVTCPYLWRPAKCNPKQSKWILEKWILKIRQLFKLLHSRTSSETHSPKHDIKFELVDNQLEPAHDFISIIARFAL